MAKPKNTLLTRGIPRFSRSLRFRLKGTFKLQKKGWPAPKKAVVAAVAPKVKEFGKKKSKRTLLPRGRNSYPTDERPIPLPSRKTHSAPRVRASIKPGTVLILLAGRHKGKRVVCLKALPSGLLMVTGPYKLNGVPLRRVNQAYVIATSTRVDISGVKIDEKYNDAYFKRTAAKSADGKNAEGKLFASNEAQVHKPDPAKVQEQFNFDKAILEAVNKTPQMAEYLKSTFTLQRGNAPHLLKF